MDGTTCHRPIMDGEITLPTTDGEDGDSFSKLNMHINNNE